MDIFAEIEIAEPTRKSVSSAAQIIGRDVDPVRQKFYDMRGMASDNPYTWSSAKLFYRQAKFMEDFTDDYDKHADFSMHSPCFQRMGYERLRTYFTWRTAVRRGEYLPIGLSYIFLYVYELLACVGVETPSQVPAGIFTLCDEYDFPSLDEYVVPWLKDFHVYYNLNFSDFVQENGMREFYSDMYAFSEDVRLSEWSGISTYIFEKSKFFTTSEENAKLFKECFSAVMGGLAAFCDTKSLRVKDLFIRTYEQEIPWIPFRRALFHPWLRQENRRVELPGGETFICEGNSWTTFHSAPYAHKKDLAAFIVKKTEVALRTKTGFRTKISADASSLQKASAALGGIGITVREIENEIEKSIANFFAEKNRVVVNIDRKNLQKIRIEADDITEKLIVEQEDKTLGVSPPIPPRGDIVPSTPKIDKGWEKFAEELSEVERAALKIMLSESGDMSKIKAFADSEGVMLEILVDGINEKAMDAIGDNILELAATLTIYEEYREQAERC